MYVYTYIPIAYLVDIAGKFRIIYIIIYNPLMHKWQEKDS
jgi:hypothetical protein